MRINRRTAMGLAAAAGLPAIPARAGDKDGQAAIAADLASYTGFGRKDAGGPGDTAAADWIAARLAPLGYAVARDIVSVPWFDPAVTTIAVAGAEAPVVPVGIVIETPATGITAPLVPVDPVTGPIRPLGGAIAVIVLPYGRWSSVLSPVIAGPIKRAMADGALAAIIVTTGPTSGAIALNADGRTPAAPRPLAVIAPKQAGPLLAAAQQGGTATLTIRGKGGRRPAINLAARIDRGRGRWLIVSTPRSGWTACAGERGPGIAAFLQLARAAPTRWPQLDLMFLCNTGHEYEYLGAEQALEQSAPPPGKTAFWLHLGANLATRDWHEAGAAGLLPLPSVDAQRFLLASAPLVAPARRLFAGLPGLEMAYPLTTGTAGELHNVAAAGYDRVAGIFGAHRFHHVAEDDARCVDAALVQAVMAPLAALIDHAVQG